jgi:hypothetical protein
LAIVERNSSKPLFFSEDVSIIFGYAAGRLAIKAVVFI